MDKAEKLLATIKGVSVPPAYDLKVWEAEAIFDTANRDRFKMIGHAFEYGFLKGQRAAKAQAAAPVELEPVVKQVQKIHSVVLALACALDDIYQNGSDPVQFVPALYGVEADLNSLEAALMGWKGGEH